MAGYYMLSTLNHICVCECVGIMPSDEPLLCGLPALPQAMGGGFDPSSQEEVLGKISKLRGNLYANFWLLWIPLWA